MGKFDLFTKGLFRESGKEVVTWLTGLVPLEVEPVATELVVAEARQTDEIFSVLLPGGPHRRRFLHVEMQTAGHLDMPRRMRRYWTRADDILSEQAKGREDEEGKIWLSSFVVYLHRKRYLPDPGEIRYRDDLGTENLHRYRVVRIWEVDPGTVYRLTRPDLVPLAPLMKTADPVATMLESREIIRAWDPRVASEQKKVDLRLALAVFSGLVIEDLDMVSELLNIDREWLEESVVVKDWLRQGREQGIEEGRREGIKQGIAQGIEHGLILARRDHLLSVLKLRFGEIGPILEASVLRLEDPERLRDLLARATVAANLEGFSRELQS